jgi:prepilin-type N-terminal cleavage/methylation domain-containing protein
MTTTTARFNPFGESRAGRMRPDSRRSGFTLVEILISSVLGSIVMAGVLSTFLFIGRSAVSVSNYGEMEAEARRGLEMFSQDVRMARDLTNFSATSVTLTVPTSTGVHFVIYSYNAGTKTFFRRAGATATAAAAATPVPIIRHVEVFSLKRYNLQQQLASNNLETKQLQLELRAVRRDFTKAINTNTVLSARFIMRNKRVSS